MFTVYIFIATCAQDIFHNYISIIFCVTVSFVKADIKWLTQRAFSPWNKELWKKSLLCIYDALLRAGNYCSATYGTVNLHCIKVLLKWSWPYYVPPWMLGSKPTSFVFSHIYSSGAQYSSSTSSNVDFFTTREELHQYCNPPYNNSKYSTALVYDTIKLPKIILSLIPSRRNTIKLIVNAIAKQMPVICVYSLPKTILLLNATGIDYNRIVNISFVLWL